MNSVAHFEVSNKPVPQETFRIDFGKRRFTGVFNALRFNT